MKTLFTILLTCLSLSAATLYPVMTDSTNRLIPGGVTNVFFLNSNAVSVGTLRVTGAVTLTNSGNVFKGDGSGLTGISSVTNLGNGANTVLATNLVSYSSGATNWPLRAIGTNGTAAFYVDKDGIIHGRAGNYNEPSILFGTSGFAEYDGAVIVIVASGGNYGNLLSYYGVGSRQDQKLWWTSSGDVAYSTRDTAIERVSAGVVSVTTGTAGTYRDLVVRSLFATNAYVTNLIVNGGATVTKILSATASLNFDLSAVTVEDLTITVTGAATGDVVTLGVPNGSVTTSVQYTAWVSAADTVTVRARTSASGEDPASGTFRATVIKH